MLLKLVLYGYYRGIMSSRRIAEACRRNVVFMALSADSRPHFTTIAAFVSSLEHESASLFGDVLLYASELGLIGKEHFAVDATCPRTPPRSGAARTTSSRRNARNSSVLPTCKMSFITFLKPKTLSSCPPVIIVAAIFWPLLGCATRTAVDTKRSSPTTPLASSVTTLADECRTIENIKALEHAPRSPYPGSIAGSDTGVRRLATLWPPAAHLREVMLGTIGNRHARHRYWDTDIGFDAKRASEMISAGFLWCTVSAALFRGELAAADVWCHWDVHPTRLGCVSERYRAVFAELGLRTDVKELSAQTDFPDILDGMNRARLEAMGESADYDLAPSSTMPANLLAAEQYLTRPLAQHSVGCLDSPPGFKEAKQLVDAGATAALRRVLRGPNPEGRGFAAVGLSKLSALSVDDLRVIERLKDTSTVVTQGGDMVTINPARSFFSELPQLHYIFERP